MMKSFVLFCVSLVSVVLAVDGQEMFSDSLKDTIGINQTQVLRFTIKELSQVENRHIVWRSNVVRLEGTPLNLTVKYKFDKSRLMVNLQAIHEKGRFYSKFSFLGCGSMVMVNQVNRAEDSLPFRFATYMSYLSGEKQSRDTYLFSKDTLLDEKNGFYSKENDNVILEYTINHYKIYES